MKETVISWTFVNWVTICLMFFSMLVIVGLAARLYKTAKDGKTSS